MEKPLRCKMGFHSYGKNKREGTKNRCILCGKFYYVKTIDDEFKKYFGDGDLGNWS